MSTSRLVLSSTVFCTLRRKHVFSLKHTLGNCDMNMRYFILSSVLCGSFLHCSLPAISAERSVAELTSDLKSSDAAERLKAIGELGSHGERAASAVAPLAALLKDKSAEVRAHAARSLGEMGLPPKPSFPPWRSW